MEEGSITCTVGKNRRLYTFQIVNGKKVRVSNSLAEGCDNVQDCGKKRALCSGRPRLPCKRKNHIFNSFEDVNGYCGLLKVKPRGDYTRGERAEIAERANEKVERRAARYARRADRNQQPPPSAKVKFVNARTRFVN